MATQETQILDNIIASRRALLVGGGAALAALAMPSVARAASTVTSYTDADILNFALNLEYLEANFYYLAAFGTNISTTNSIASGAGGSVIGITGTGTQGTVISKPSPKVPFANNAVAAYATVAQPQIDLMTSFNQLATAAGISIPNMSGFDPFYNDATFLIGAYIFEDVGVTAYHGAAPLISTTTMGKTYLAAATGILAVEAYHAGLVRTTINALDPTGSLGYIGYTKAISGLRAKLSLAALGTAPNPDDIPLTPGTTMVSLAGATAVTSTTIVDADLTNVIAFSRNTTQVLNIVTGGGATSTGVKATGVFFPNGLNGLFS
jgi:hypothetical protein